MRASNACAYNLISPSVSTRFYLSSPRAKNNSFLPVGQNISKIRTSCSTRRGDSRSPRTRGRGRWPLLSSQGVRGMSGRSSRVVLSPRRWGQAAQKRFAQATGANKPGTPGRARSSRSTIAQGMPDVSVTCGNYARMLFVFRIRGCGCIARPAFPVPSVLFEGQVSSHHSGVSASRDCGGVSSRCLKIESGLAVAACSSRRRGNSCRGCQRPRAIDPFAVTR